MESPITVLYVGEEADFGETLANQLREDAPRIEVEVVPSAEAGLAALSARDIDCIVSEYDLPGGTGIEFLKQVRETNPRISFILFPESGSEEIASQAINAGVTAYHRKEAGTEHDATLADRILDAVSESRNDRAVKRTREYFSTILEQASDYVMIVGEDGQINYISPAVERVLGYSPATLMERDAFEFTHPEDQGTAVAAFAALFEYPDEENTVEFRARHADGSWRWLEVRGNNLLDDPIIDGILVNVRDITERKDREAEIQELTERLELAVEGANLGIWDWDMVTGEVTRDETVTRMLGYSPEEIGTRHEAWDELVHPEGKQRYEEALEAHIQNRTPHYQCEYRVKTAAGDWKWIRTVGKVVERDEEGEPVRAVGIHFDITERKEREQQLREERERLDEFASVLSHDLRNPLNVAQGRLKLAREEYDSEHLEAAAEGIERSLGLIDDVLVLARAGKDVRGLEPVDVAALANESWKMVETADASLIVDCELTIRADRTRFRQLLENVFRNAIEHGGADVTVRVGSLPAGFYVEDDGPGIPEDKREAVWTAGYSRTEGGIGFGLSIIKQVAEAHGWDIQITDGSGGGARFEITGVEVTDE